MMGSNDWALVELYRWQHGELPPQDGTAKPLDIQKGLEAVALALGESDPKKWPHIFNVGQVLAFAGRKIKELEAEQQATIEAVIPPNRDKCSDCGHSLVWQWMPGRAAAMTGPSRLVCPRCVLGRAEKAEAEVTRLQDQLDLNRDEFMRIRNCPAADEEIKGLCDRSQVKIAQHVTVIAQRDKAERERDKARTEVERLQEPTLARHQPCGCIICNCDDPVQCHGCGAKNCGAHEPGEIPNPVYETHPLMAENAELREALKDARDMVWKSSIHPEGNQAAEHDVIEAAIEETRADKARSEESTAVEKWNPKKPGGNLWRFSRACTRHDAAMHDQNIARQKRRKAVERLGE